VRNERGARVARGSAIAGFATFTASLAHTLGGGLPPGPLTVALALAFSVPFAIATVGRRSGIIRAAVAAVGAQLALHALYSLGPVGAPATVTMTDGSADGGAHVHSQHVQVTQTLVSASTDAAAVAHTAHPASWMLLTHTLAAALTIAFIAGAARVLARVLAAVAGLARGIRVAWGLVTAPLPTPSAGHTRRPEASAARLARDLHLVALSHRGPPAPAPAA
jgi:hypothetical protein